MARAALDAAETPIRPRLSARLLAAVYDPEVVYAEALAVVLGAADEAGRRGPN